MYKPEERSEEQMTYRNKQTKRKRTNVKKWERRKNKSHLITSYLKIDTKLYKMKNLFRTRRHKGGEEV